MNKTSRIVTKKQEARARAIVQRAMNQQRQREHEERTKLIGRCFKYPNRYSDGTPWWLYAVVTSVQDTRVLTRQFQHDSMDTLSLQCEVYGWLLPAGGWEEIPVAEFERAAVKFGLEFLQKLATATPIDATEKS